MFLRDDDACAINTRIVQVMQNEDDDDERTYLVFDCHDDEIRVLSIILSDLVTL